MKKFTAVFICLLMIVACNLAGCASFSIDKEKYYNEVLATVGNTNITRFDLLTAYNSYGKSYYYSQQGQDETAALNSTLDLLIDKESLYQYALTQGETFKPTAYQVNEIVSDIFDSLDSQMETYMESAEKILGVTHEDDPEEESKTNSTAYLFENYTYTKRAEVVKDGNNYKIVYVAEEDKTVSTPLLEERFLNNHTEKDIISTIKSNYLTRLSNQNNNSQVEKKALQLFANDLMSYEKYLLDANGKHYSKSFSDLLYRYIERTFNSKIQSQYIENIRINYLKTEELDIQLLLDVYQESYRVAYELYDEEDEIEDYKTKIKDIGTKGDTILYHPNMTDGTKFGYFLHTLISFDDNQKAKIKNFENEVKEDKKQNAINSTIAKTKVKARNSETGLIDEDAEYVTLAEIIEEYNTITGTYEEKLAKFIDFMFKYTGDAESTLVSGMPYVIGHNYNTNEDYSSMVTEFNAEATKLMKNGVKGTMSSFSLENIGEMCVTEYGIHFLFYVGDVNEYDIDSSSYLSTYIQSDDKVNMENLNLYTKIANPLTGKTYFDMLFDAVYPANGDSIYTSNTGYDDEEDRLINLIQSQSGHKVTKYVTKINATKTSLN